MASIGKFLLWVFAIFGMLTTAVVAAVVLFSLSVRDKAPELTDGSVLALDWNGAIPEHRARESLFPDQEITTLLETVRAIELAADAPEIQALAVTMGRVPIGFAQAQELAAAVQAFRESGKPAYVFAEDLSAGGDATSTVLLAAAFDQIWLQPSGSVGLTGVALEIPFAAEALDEIGISPEFEQRHEFKGGADSLTNRRMPLPLRQSLQQVANGLLDQAVTAIAAGRNLEPQEVRRLTNNGPHLARDALSAGLIDRTAYLQDFESFIDTEFSNPVWVSDAFVLAATEPEETDTPLPRVAILYGIGAIAPPNGDDGPFADRGFDSPAVIDVLNDIASGEADVDAVLFRVVSPGGAYGPSDAVWDAVGRVRDTGIPVVVSMGDIAASGGYFVAADADRILAQPGTLTGSIGVYGGTFDASELWNSLGVNWEQITAGANAGMWSPNRGLDRAERDRLASAIDFVYEDFTTKVAEGRELSADQLNAAARGRIWLGTDAVEVGLVDELGGFTDALDATRDLLELEADAALDLIVLPEPISPLELLAEAAGSGDFSLLAGTLVADGIEERIEARARSVFGSSVLFHAPTGILSAPPILIQGHAYGILN